MGKPGSKTTKLYNLRLSSEDVRRVEELRERGVEVSELLRRAIRAEHQRTCPKLDTPEEVENYFKELYAKYPAPDNAEHRNIDTTDRHAVREYIINHLKHECP